MEWWTGSGGVNHTRVGVGESTEHTAIVRERAVRKKENGQQE